MEVAIMTAIAAIGGAIWLHFYNKGTFDKHPQKH